MRRKGFVIIGFSTLLVTFLTALPLISDASDSVTLTLFGPESFYRNQGAPTPSTRTFSVPSVQGDFVLTVVNGSGAADNLISSAVIKINGTPVVTPANLNQKVATLEIPLNNLFKGNNSLVVEVRSIPSSFIKVSITGTYMLGVHIINPVPLMVIDGNKTTVEGTFVNYTNDVGITVNGRPAVVKGNAFVINDVPLVSGSNSIKALITTIDGVKNSEEIFLTANGNKPSLGLWTNITYGVPLMEVTFRPLINGIEPVEYRYDFNGDGISDLSKPDIGSVIYTFNTPGTYRARVTAVDSSGQIYIAEKMIVLEKFEVIHNRLMERWNTLSNALLAQDLEKSLANIIPASRDRYKKIFNLLGSKLPEVIASLTSPLLIQVDGNIAEYQVQREEVWNGIPRMISHSVWFARDDDGLWKIDRF